MTPRLTIAIPTVNRARLLPRAIESALAQTSREIEVIVSNNGSTDETASVIARYSGHSALRAFHHDSTMSAARHGDFLREKARGEFFVGLSDDDFLEPEFAAEVLSLFERRPELSFVYTGCAVHYGDIEVPSLVGPLVESSAEFLAAQYAGKREISWCACASRTNLLRKFGPQPDDRIIGDMFFWTKAVFEGPVGCVPRVLSHYILLREEEDDNNISHGTPPAVWGSEQRLLADEVLQGWRKRGAPASYLARLSSACREYVARSTANQFVWTRIRGASWATSFASIARCAPFLSLSVQAWTRVLTALLIPRRMLRSLLLNAAARRGKARTCTDPNAAIMRPADAV